MKTWSQCLNFALDKWHTSGGRIVFRRSTHWPIAHAQHTNDESELSHFTPPHDLKTPAHALIGFWGEVLHHDMEPCRPMSIGGIVGSAALLFFGTVIWAVKTTAVIIYRRVFNCLYITAALYMKRIRGSK